MTKTKSGTVEIVQKDAPVLREIAKSVPAKDISSKKLRDIVERMKEALASQDDGVAIAAPQIGESLRIFVVSGQALALSSKKKASSGTKVADLVFFNPVIVRASKKKKQVEEGCLSVRWLYGTVNRSEKVVLKALDENGQEIERGASGLLAQIFQHEMDHLDGVLFTDKAENLHDMPPAPEVKYAFFGSLSGESSDAQFSRYVLEELENAGFPPALVVGSTKKMPTLDELKALDADVFIVASFGKILSKELIDLPKRGTLNVHPSLLPKLRGAAPIQNTILGKGEPGVTIIKMDEEMDHGGIVAQTELPLSPWPDHYAVVEEKLGRVGGEMLAAILPKWVAGEIEERAQDESEATYTKLIKKEDGLIDLMAPAEDNFRKVLAYSTWPGAYFMYKNKKGKEIRIVVKDAELTPDKDFRPTRVIPEGKKEMGWEDFLNGQTN